MRSFFDAVEDDDGPAREEDIWDDELLLCFEVAVKGTWLNLFRFIPEADVELDEFRNMLFYFRVYTVFAQRSISFSI